MLHTSELYWLDGRPVVLFISWMKTGMPPDCRFSLVTNKLDLVSGPSPIDTRPVPAIKKNIVLMDQHLT